MISESFKKDVDALPGNYKKNNKENTDKFKTFFVSWGNHVIIGQKIGGSVEGIIERNNLSSEAIKSAIYETLNSVSNEEVDEEGTSTMDASLKWNGGDPKQHVAFWRELNIDQCQEWGNSLLDEAVALNSYQLEPIYESVGKIDREKSLAVKEAFKDLMKVELRDEIASTRISTGRQIIKRLGIFSSAVAGLVLEAVSMPIRMCINVAEAYDLPGGVKQVLSRSRNVIDFGFHVAIGAIFLNRDLIDTYKSLFPKKK